MEDWIRNAHPLPRRKVYGKRVRRILGRLLWRRKTPLKNPAPAVIRRIKPKGETCEQI